MLLEGGGKLCPWYASKWWKDLVSLEGTVGLSWFNSKVVRRVGNGMKTSFWNDIWRGVVPLRTKYPRLYAISNQKDLSISEMMEVNDLIRSLLGVVLET